MLIIVFSRESSPPLGQMAKSVQEAPRADAGKTPETRAPAPAAETATAQPTQHAAENPGGTAAESGGTAAEKKPAAAVTLRTTDGLGSGREPARAPDEQVRVGTSGGQASQPSSSGSQRPPSSESKSKAGVATRAEPSTSHPREQTGKSERDKPAPSTVTTEHRPEAAEPSRSTSREARRLKREARERERQARRNAERSEPRTARTEEPDFETTTPAFDDEVRSGREESSRPARAATRNARGRSGRANDDEDYIVVRSQRSLGGGGERTVVEEPRRERIETRRVIREEPVRPRLPFFFDLFNPGGRED